METGDITKQVLVLCDNDALYSAIELNLNGLPQVRVVRSDLNPKEEETKLPLSITDVDLIILATASSANNLATLLFKRLPNNPQTKPPILIISEQLTRPVSDNRISYLNFPFDMYELTNTVKRILHDSSISGV